MQNMYYHVTSAAALTDPLRVESKIPDIKRMVIKIYREYMGGLLTVEEYIDKRAEIESRDYPLDIKHVRFNPLARWEEDDENKESDS